MNTYNKYSSIHLYHHIARAVFFLQEGTSPYQSGNAQSSKFSKAN
jgi:hypothetical protein